MQELVGCLWLQAIRIQLLTISKQGHVGRPHHKDSFINSFFVFWRQDAHRKQSPVQTIVELDGQSLPRRHTRSNDPG